MPIGKLTATKRGKSAIAAVMIGAILMGHTWYTKGSDGKQHPATVVLAVEKAIAPWEGFAAKAYYDRIAKPPVWTCGYGDTLNCKPGTVWTQAQAKAKLIERAEKDFYLPMKKCITNLDDAPVGVGASMISGAYNFGVARWCHSTAARLVSAKKYKEACAAQTAFNKAGGKVIIGLVKRREMGDAQRLGEAEMCLSGL